uniref:mS47 n=1 Tax=Trypanosoma brucei brucei TaxID=5702 RepID=UPI000E6AE36C|nr:Chain Cv, mS47 [Trypanosoma brucei brucei]6HIY_Cv Chain Cv, mS47 [Trypanosoma brucei brucei]
MERRRLLHDGRWFTPCVLYGSARRGLKTLDVREYRPLAMPIEFRFYQRYANHPNRQSGIQFLTHYNTHQRFRVNKDYIDYMHWGKEQGQARLPHRHQRVAFDFNDQLHPTRIGTPEDGGNANHCYPEDGEDGSYAWFASQDPTFGHHPDLSSSFDPNYRVFSHPEHWNKMFTKRRPGEGDIDLSVLPSRSLLGPLMAHSDTKGIPYFKVDNRGHSNGRVPGVNAPFFGEFDQKMMQAMSRPLNANRTITGNDGRFSKTIMINEPQCNQALSAKTASELSKEIDKATNAVYSKLSVLEAAQSGLTDYFCGGLNFEIVGFELHMAAMLRERAAAILERSGAGGLPSASSATLSSSSTTRRCAMLLEKADEREVNKLLRDASRYEDRVDDALRQHASLIWRVYTAPRPLMTLTNGKCRGTGCGLSLFAKYCALKDSSEFIFDGPNVGITPYGGMTRLLARPETSLKYPGLAEFVVLTGASLFAGDALRLGWTDLFTTIPDMTYHIKEWFDTTEHMHNDAVAWQLGHLLETCFKMKESHSSAMERAAITPTRARWVEDAFADQPSVNDIMRTLTEIEQLPFQSTHNTSDESHITPYTLGSVAAGVQRLGEHRLRYTLSPWDITPPEDSVVLKHTSEMFRAYVLERRGATDVVTHRDAERAAAWSQQRQREYDAYCSLKEAPHPRHVYARLEGCEGKIVSFEFVFEISCRRSGPQGTDEVLQTTTISRLKSRILDALGMPRDRNIDLGWYLPTLDTCPIHSDEELMQVLHTDPGIEDPKEKLRYPPIYFIVKRCTLYFSEWAYAVKHQLLLQSPFALRAAFGLLQEVRGDGAAENVMPLAETLGTEFKYFTRLMRRPDFYRVGVHTDKSVEKWEEIKEERRHNIHHTHRPTRPLPDFEEVFERDVEIDGHRFVLRPRWNPRTLQDVDDSDILRLRAPLTYDMDSTAALHVPTHCGKASRLAGMLQDAGGVQVLDGLGEVDDKGEPKVPPLQSNASVPTNVSFYEMARHPWEDRASSWRRDGFTEGSLEYFESQYRSAERAVYDEEGRGVRNYWPSRDAVEGIAQEEENDAQLLQERLFNTLETAGTSVEPWARNLRLNATTGKFGYKTEIATQEEKIYDDEYYRWFIQPGRHPNPSGLTLNGRKGQFEEGHSRDEELERMWRKVVADGNNDFAATTSGMPVYDEDAKNAEDSYAAGDDVDVVTTDANVPVDGDDSS